MASQAVSKGSKRIKLSPNSDEKDDVNSGTTDEQGHSSVDTALDKKTVESGDEQNSKSTKKDSELVVISSSSSDDDSDKELKANTIEPVIKKEKAETSLDVLQSKLPVNQTESLELEQASKQIKVATEPKSDRNNSDSDECISQEDLLAQLGLSSVKELNKKRDK